MVRLLFVFVVAFLARDVRADEGMWLLNDFPAKEVERRYGFKPDQAFLDHIRLGAVRLAGGCSASFVSPRGLVMTNHHCIRSCIQDLSTAQRDYLENGFVAKTDAAELRCPKVEANQLVEITDVTSRVLEATKGKDGAAFNAALKAETSAIERACATGDRVRCDVVTLFHGGKYHLYKYRRFQDVRLAFAPEFPMAAFGGDPDNFNFPRYGFDVAFMRVYEDGKPAKTDHYLQWAKTPAKPGDLVFVAGHPGGTERVQTVEQLALQRDVVLPWFVRNLAEKRGLYLQFQEENPNLFRVTRARTRSVENGLKALGGRHRALAEPEFFALKAEQDRALRSKVDGNPQLKAKYGGAWKTIADAVGTYRGMHREYRLIEARDGFDSDLFNHARTLVRAAEERTKPDAERLREYTTAQLPAVEQLVRGAVPIPREVEELTLAFSLRRLQEELGADDPFVRAVLGSESPRTVARKLVRGTKLADPKVRARLYEGGKDAVAASKDPMIAFAQKVEARARPLRKAYEEQVQAPLKKAGELLNQAHVAVHGTAGYPDATFTLRLSFGQVQGWEEDGKKIPALTTVGGLFERHTGEFPFAVSKAWLRARKKLDPSTPVNMATTHDIIGGNSGSPVVNREGRVVGIIFDGNLPSLAGRYAYDPAKNRAVAVHGEAIEAGLRHVYGATRIAEELKQAR